jgi:hypothetical protein
MLYDLNYEPNTVWIQGRLYPGHDELRRLTEIHYKRALIEVGVEIMWIAISLGSVIIYDYPKILLSISRFFTCITCSN